MIRAASSTLPDAQGSDFSDPVLPAVNEAAESHATPDHSNDFFVVCIGASAGDLQPILALVRNLSPSSGLAYVIIQHLDPTHESHLAEFLSRETRIAVVQASNNLAIRANCIHLIPPGKDMVLGNGLLQLSPRSESHGQHRPIDTFMRSIAEEQGHKCIGVVLSGDASDGTLGLEEIKAAGGITFAQDNSAAHTSMPRNAIASGSVDFVLPPTGIADQLTRISRHPLVALAERGKLALDEDALSRILELIRQATGVDFGSYKRNTLDRRIARRIVIHQLESFRDYAQLVQRDPSELDALYQDILINVTSFFRNPEAYEALKKIVFAKLTSGKSRHEDIRVWALGCSTGEEAYSLAMIYTEFAEATGKRVLLQIFATDLNAAGIEHARRGIYPKGITQDVSPERLRRFFVEVDGSYRICKPIRDMCVFARQNVLGDPPFARMDLIACRNMLIYLEPVLQKQILPTLHYSLRPEGFLWLGSTETIGAFGELFDIVDPKHQIYRKKPGFGRPLLSAQSGSNLLQIPTSMNWRVREAVSIAMDPQKEADRQVIARYAPPGVVVNGDWEIIQFRGATGAFLEPSPGRPSLNLLKMLREGLFVGVRNTLNRAKRDGISVREKNVRVTLDNDSREINVVVIPLKPASSGPGNMLVLFEETGEAFSASYPPGPAPTVNPATPAISVNEIEVAMLIQELDATRECLQSMIEQQETVNEELQSANEEAQSANEELQSINEQLGTSKEEIQSSHEELAIVNDELQNRNLALSRSNNDLVNLLSSVNVAIVMLDADLRVRHITPSAEKTLNLIPADIGRPISDIKINLNVPDLKTRLNEVIATHTVQEFEVQDHLGRFFSLRLRPYKTVENKIDGAVLVVVDIDNVKRAQRAVQESEARFALLADSAPVLIWVSSPDGSHFVNRAYRHFLGISERAFEKFDWFLHMHPDDRNACAADYLDCMARRSPFSAMFRIRRHDGVWRWMKADALPRLDQNGELLGYVGCAVDVTELKLAEAALRDADRSKNEFLAVLAHELRNPLAAVRNAARLLSFDSIPDETMAESRAVIERQSTHMVRMVDDLLDVSRISRGHFNLRLAPINIAQSADEAVAATAHLRAARNQQLEFSAPGTAIMVAADAARLSQLLTNLLGNASKFTPHGGHLALVLRIDQIPFRNSVTGTSAEHHALIQVSDDGIGMDPMAISSMFDMFVQGRHTRDEMRAGMGIGLSLARRIVELHGGVIEASSAGPGKGSTFRVRLPLLPTEPS